MGQGKGLESESLPGTHQGRHTPSPGLGFSVWQFDAGCGAGTPVEDSGRPPGEGNGDSGDWETPAAEAGAQMAGRLGLRIETACGLALSMVLPALRSSTRGQRRPLPSSPRRSRGLTPGKQPWKPDRWSIPLGTGQSPEERKGGEEGTEEAWRIKGRGDT